MVVERIALKLFFALNIMYECLVYTLHLIWLSHTQKTIRRRRKTRNIPIFTSLFLLPSPFYPLATKRPPVLSLPFLPSPFHRFAVNRPSSSPSPSFIPIPSLPFLPCPFHPLPRSSVSVAFVQFGGDNNVVHFYRLFIIHSILFAYMI